MAETLWYCTTCSTQLPTYSDAESHHRRTKHTIAKRMHKAYWKGAQAEKKHHIVEKERKNHRKGRP